MAKTVQDVLSQIREEPLEALGEDRIDAAVSACDHTFRDRKLPPPRLLSLMLAQGVHGYTAIDNLRHVAGMEASPQAFSQARQRLPLEVLRHVAVEMAADAQNQSEEEAAWSFGDGHRVHLLDATTFGMGNLDELAEHFGRSSNAGPKPSRKPTFPFGQALMMADLHSNLIVDVATGPGFQYDMHGMMQMHGDLVDGDLMIGDRHFCSAAHFSLAEKHNLHLLARVKLRGSGDDSLDLPEDPPEEMRVVIESDQRRKLRVQRSCPVWMDEDAFVMLDEEVEVREVIYRVQSAAYRTRRVAIHTTLLGPEAYPAEELARLYFKRWQVEVDFRNLKRTLGGAVFRGRSVDVVKKELWSVVMAYNAVALVMLESARRQSVDPARISFIDATRWLRVALIRDGDLGPVPLEELKVNPPEKRWWEPRVLMRRKDRYDYANKPRAEYHREREKQLGVPTRPRTRAA